MFEVSNDPCGRDVREPDALNLMKNQYPAVVMFEVSNEPCGRDVREPDWLKLSKKAFPAIVPALSVVNADIAGIEVIAQFTPLTKGPLPNLHDLKVELATDSFTVIV